MPRYDYECCSKWEQYADYDSRDNVRCSGCGRLANRCISQFVLLGASYPGTNRFEGAERALGSRIESTKDLDKRLKEVGAQPVDAYYRPPRKPEPKEITLEELNPYLDGMPLNG